MPPKISVIIPTYKPKEYIWDCLHSLYRQSLDKKLFEIILILNGCCEPYKSELEQFIANELSGVDIKLLQTDCGGVSNARNIGLDEAQGEYLTFIDDDDYVSPTYLEDLYAKAAPGTVVFSDAISFEDGSDQLNEQFYMHRCFTKNAEISHPSLFSIRSLLNGPCGKLFDCDIIGNRRFNLKFKNGEDSLMMLLISDRIKNIKLTSTNAVYYRRFRLDSATTSKRRFVGRVANALNLTAEFSRIVLSKPFSYYIPFVASRYVAVLKGAFLNR